jgi:hypothetical protein
VTGYDGRQRFSRHDFYLSELSQEPARLTDFELYELGPLDIFDRKLMFKAVGARKEKHIIPDMQPLARSQSEIFVIKFDPKDPKIVTPEHTLEPLYMIEDSYSVRQTVSPDGSKVALINTRTGRNYRYDLVIATIDGTVLKRVEASTFQFSRAAFAGPNTVLANQLFKDRYEVTMVDLADYSVRIVAIVDHSENALRNLEHIQIPSISN